MQPPLSDHDQDRYRELLTAAREFSFARLTKRMDVDPEEPLAPRSLAVLCPQCPQPGINMDPKYEEAVEPRRYGVGWSRDGSRGSIEVEFLREYE